MGIKNDHRFVRETEYDFGTEIIKSRKKRIICEYEYLTEEKDLEQSRLLWVKTIPDGYYLKLSPDPFHIFKSPKQTSDLCLADEAKTYYHTISKGQNPIDEISITK